MDQSETGNDTSSTSTQEPGDGRRAEGDAKEGLDQPLAEEHVHTQEQRNQSWTGEGSVDPRREGGESSGVDTTPAPTLDMPDELESKLDDVMAHPHSDAQEGGAAPDGASEGDAQTGSGE